MKNKKLQVKAYNNITEFLLFFVRERPGMYLGEPKLSKLQNFIIGYQIGFSINNIEQDYYFGEDGFFEWYCNKYNKGPYSFCDTPFMEEAKDDDKEALQVYFKYLLEFYSERSKIVLETQTNTTCSGKTANTTAPLSSITDKPVR